MVSRAVEGDRAADLRGQSAPPIARADAGRTGPPVM